MSEQSHHQSSHADDSFSFSSRQRCRRRRQMCEPLSHRRRHAQLTSSTAEMPRTQALRAVKEKRKKLQIDIIKDDVIASKGHL